ncbi:hypothetical protein Strvi_2456 [Streptomyces violaceusniger Tu 4113]|uniref:Uncharacterized protein n=1 Tax=Streptomyces violaceusniger (strain Tu 4113) TaxID=653045 RepID=G2P2Q3_STRV4|nr:hypothetical protein Strvi_2456 [Streptomyces violaceusniger Tu 4113]
MGGSAAWARSATTAPQTIDGMSGHFQRSAQPSGLVSSRMIRWATAKAELAVGTPQ